MDCLENISAFEHAGPYDERLDQKFEEGIDITEIKSGRGRKSRISRSTKDNLVRTVRRKPLTSSTRTLSKQYQISVGYAYDVLTERGLKYESVPKIRPFMMNKKRKNLLLPNHAEKKGKALRGSILCR